MKHIQLWKQRTGGFIYSPTLVPLTPARFTICDDVDYPWLSQWRWYLIPSGDTYARCVLWVSPDECRIETMHRMVMEAYCGPDDRHIAHTDRDNLNNQRSNLQWKAKGRRHPRHPGGGYGVLRFDQNSRIIRRESNETLVEYKIKG
jgi:hypothetical protein